MVRMVAALVCAASVGGCGVDARVRTMDSYGQMSVEKSRSPGSDYTVSIKNIADIGVDPDDKPTRDRMVLTYISGQCPAGQIVGEDAIETGKTPLGVQMRTYQVRVKC